MKPTQAKQIALSVLQGNNTPFFLGGTGIGKSAIVESIAHELSGERKLVRDAINPTANEFGFIDFRLSLYESVDLGGLPYIDDDNTQKRAFLGNLPQGGEGLLFFDEYAQASGSLQAIVGQIIYEGRIGEYALPDGWKVICAGNRASDRASSNKLPSHVIGRCSIIDFDHSTEDWLAWASVNDVHQDVIAYIGYRQDALNVFDPKVVTPQPSPRSWTRLSDTLKTEPPKSLWQETFKCDVGEEQAIEFSTFLSLKDDVPNLGDILSGKKVDVPDSVGVCYATICALLGVMSEANDEVIHDYFKNAVAYVEGFPTPEFAIMFVRQITSKREELRESKTFVDFKVANQDLEL
tara:strand:+ start:1353 stop:2402 length:1050 start_codon:yes stop_codon:yes gene_type:complete